MCCNGMIHRRLNDNVIEHLVEDRVYVYCNNDKKDRPIDKRRLYSVFYNSETKEVECECKLFECHGILCKHCFKVFDLQQVTEVPQRCILDRWRKDSFRKHTRIQVAYHDILKTKEVLRFDKMMVAFESVCGLASDTEKRTNIVIQALHELDLKVKQNIGSPPKSSMGECSADLGSTLFNVNRHTGSSSGGNNISAPRPERNRAYTGCVYFSGLPILVFEWQKMENPDFCMALGVKSDQNGILATQVEATAPEFEVLKSSDIILSFDGVDIGNDGTGSCD